MEKLGKLGKGPCLCPSLVSFLLRHPECYHQFACHGRNWLIWHTQSWGVGAKDRQSSHSK